MGRTNVSRDDCVCIRTNEQLAWAQQVCEVNREVLHYALSLGSYRQSSAEAGMNVARPVTESDGLPLFPQV